MLSLFPTQLQLSDRFTDTEGDGWEVASRPVTYRQGREVRANVQRPGNPATKKEAYWPAHEKITVRRESAGSPGRDDAHGDELRAELRRLRGEVLRQKRIAHYQRELEQPRAKNPRETST